MDHPAQEPGPARERAVTAAVVAAALLGTALAALALARWSGRPGVRAADDLGQLGAAAVAALTAARTAAAASGSRRRCWAAFALGAGAWAAGQALWSWQELVQHRPGAFPSPADAGFLTLPVAMIVGLWLLSATDARGARRRRLFDAGIVVSALLAISWITVLGRVVAAGGMTAPATAVAVAYPVGDVLVLSMTLLRVCRSAACRTEFGLIGLATAGMAVADSGFAYLNGSGAYRTGRAIDVGWIASFLLLAAAARRAARRPDGDRERAGGEPVATSMLPYLPLVAAFATAAALRAATGRQPGAVAVGAVLIGLLLVLARQHDTLRENRRLLDQVLAGERALELQALQDPLTGLANRALFTDRVRHALELHRRGLRPLAVVLCDLDDFKTVNDTLGNGAGDALLVRVAERLRGALGSGDTLARLGGDEFAVLLEDGGDDPVAVAARLADALDEPFVLAGTQLSLRASVGFTELDADQDTVAVDTLLAQAEIAMYAAKRRGAPLAAYTSDLAVPHVDDLYLAGPLARAIADGTLGIAFQPLVDLTDGRVYGFESLARWTHEGEPVSPARFIPVATRAGLLGPLTAHMLDRACAQLARWNAAAGHHRLRVGVNVPPALIADRGFPCRVARVVERHGVLPEQLVLEITEDALLGDLDKAKAVTARLRALGVRLSLDDFGCGYSSLLHLQQIPLNSIKIDQGFVAGIDRDPAAARFTAALLGLGTELGLLVIAEGIERTSQAELLRAMGCTLAQGYLFSRPLPAVEFDPLVAASTAEVLPVLA